MDNNFNILPKFTGKYIHKSIRIIVFWVILPFIAIIAYLILFANDKLTNFLSVL
jgi:hypothetical protein